MPTIGEKITGIAQLLQGVNALSQTIVGQAGAISKMRTDAATMRARGEIGLLNARFLADIDSFKIKPEDYESAFANHQATLEEFANSVEFAPARDQVRGIAESALPEIYLRGAQAMNRQQFSILSADWMKGYSTISQDPTKSPLQIKDERMQAIDQAKGEGWADPMKLEELRASALQDYKIQNANEIVRSKGSLQDGIDLLYDNEALKKAGLGNLTNAERDTLALGLQNEQTNKTRTIKAQYSENLRNSTDQFIDTDLLKKEISGLDISPAEKDKILEDAKIHNDDALYTSYLQRINNTSDMGELGRIQDDLRKEKEWAGEMWIGETQEQRRAGLLSMLQGKLTKGDETGISAARLRQSFEAFKNGIPINGKVPTWGETYSTALLLLTNDKANPEFKSVVDDLDSFMPVGAKTTFEGLKSLVQGSSKESDFWKKNPEAAAWAMDSFQDFVKSNPNASQDVYAKEATNIKSIYLTKEWDFVKGKKYEEGAFGNTADQQLFDLGARAQGGKLSSAVNIDPRTGMVEVAPKLAPALGQLRSRETEWARDRFGKNLTSIVNENGMTALQDESGNLYHFDYQTKPPVLLDSRGDKVAEIQNITVMPRPELRPVTIPRNYQPPSDVNSVQLLSNIKSAENDNDRAMAISKALEGGVITILDINALGFNRGGQSIKAIPQEPIKQKEKITYTPAQSKYIDRITSAQDDQERQKIITEALTSGILDISAITELGYKRDGSRISQ